MFPLIQEGEDTFTLLGVLSYAVDLERRIQATALWGGMSLKVAFVSAFPG
jgi:hypothetical protein